MVTFTTNKLLEKPVVGGDVNLWGPPLNTNATLIDQITSLLVTVSVNSMTGNVALTQADMQYLGWNITGTQSGAIVIQPFTGMGGVYFVKNSSADVVTIQTAVPGTSISVVNGFVGIAITDGTNVFSITTSSAPSSVTTITAGGVVSASPGLNIINYVSPIAVQVNLPASPIVGAEISVKDGNGSAGTHNITVSGNGKVIDGLTTQTINTAYGLLSMTYNGTAWNIVS